MEIESSSLVLRISKTLLLMSSFNGESFFPFCAGGFDELRGGFIDFKIKGTILGVLILKQSKEFFVFE
jgi:hypothetical protein